jgi:peptidoglycan/xylan/chitin deacetylase (PgdA/CDA1 family)
MLVAALLASCSSGTDHATKKQGSAPPSSTTASTTTRLPSATTVPPVSPPSSPSSTSTPPPPPTSPSAPPPSTTVPTPTALFGRVWQVIPTRAHVVALTFDAGANADGLPAILSTLRTAGVPATFFLTANFVRSFPTLSSEIVRGGYRLGDHSVDHPYFTHLSDSQIRSEVLDAASTIRSVTGADPAPLFRFPYGDYDARTLAAVNALGYVAVGWTVDTLGWEGTSSGITQASIVSRVRAALQPGEIVVMHVGSNPDDRSTLDAQTLPDVIAALRGAGYSFVTLADLVG